MGSARGILLYKPLLAGLIFLLMALIMAIVGLHSAPVHYSIQDSFGPGNYTLGNASFEKGYVDYNRTLILSSNNASVVIREGEMGTRAVNVTSTVTLHPRARPSIEVVSGRLNCTYSVRALNYPYSNLAIPGVIFTIVGTSLVIAGYVTLSSRR